MPSLYHMANSLPSTLVLTVMLLMSMMMAASTYQGSALCLPAPHFHLHHYSARWVLLLAPFYR